MPEQLAARASWQVRRVTWSIACALPLCGIPVGVFAQSAPTGLRACSAESDPARRLACYDREMGHHAAPPARPAAGPPLAKPNLPASSAPAAAPATTPHAVIPASAAPEAASHQASAPHAPPALKIFGDTWHLTAHVARLDRWPDAMVLHLDNGQVWQQVGRASGDLNLHTGDSVTIEEHFGSYWLSSGYVSHMQVRLKPQ
jgi:hypothetical protein